MCKQRQAKFEILKSTGLCNTDMLAITLARDVFIRRGLDSWLGGDSVKR